MKTKILSHLMQYLPVYFYFLGLILVSVAAFVNNAVVGFLTMGILAIMTAALLAAGKGE